MALRRWASQPQLATPRGYVPHMLHPRTVGAYLHVDDAFGPSHVIAVENEEEVIQVVAARLAWMDLDPMKCLISSIARTLGAVIERYTTLPPRNSVLAMATSLLVISQIMFNQSQSAPTGYPRLPRNRCCPVNVGSGPDLNHSLR